MTIEDGLKLTKKNIRRYVTGLAHVVAAQGFRKIDLMVYGGSALLLAANFRESTHDLDAFPRVDDPAPVQYNQDLQLEAMFLQNAAEALIPVEENCGNKWFDSSVYLAFEGSPVKLSAKENHIFLETLPAEMPVFDIYVPDQSLMLAMKTKSMRLEKHEDGRTPKDLDDLVNLLALHPEIKNDESLINFSAKFFPDIGKNPNAITGAKRLFTEYRDHPTHPAPFYAKGGRPEP